MRLMDLELYTRDIGCKNWPTRELVPLSKFSSLVSWSVKQRLVLHPNYWHKKTKTCLGTIGLSACAEWNLSFVQEILGVRTGPQGSWFHPVKSLPVFLDLWSTDWTYIQIAGTRKNLRLGTIRLSACAANCGHKKKIWVLRLVYEQLDCLHVLGGPTELCKRHLCWHRFTTEFILPKKFSPDESGILHKKVSN